MDGDGRASRGKNETETAYSGLAEDDVGVSGGADVDVRTTDDEDGALLAPDRHLSHPRHLLQTCMHTERVAR